MSSYNSSLIIAFTHKAKHLLFTANMLHFRSYKNIPWQNLHFRLNDSMNYNLRNFAGWVLTQMFTLLEGRQTHKHYKLLIN